LRLRAISSAVEHSLHTGGVAGSIPASPTIFLLTHQWLSGGLSDVQATLALLR
jgi:hypothetical protein